MDDALITRRFRVGTTATNGLARLDSQLLLRFCLQGKIAGKWLVVNSGTVGERLLYTSQHHPILADTAKRFPIPPPQIVVLMIPGPSFRGLCPYV